MKINYVIAAWSGPRRYDIEEAKKDRGFFLREHIASLTNVRHSLDQITVVIARNPEETPEFTNVWQNLPKQIGTAKVDVFHRDNVGLSYGAWSDAYGRTRQDFDFYLFMEDDYQFCMHDFDKALVDTIRPEVGYLCGLVRPGQLPKHAGNANGLLRTEALEAVWQRVGMLPHYTVNADYGGAEGAGQVGLSQAVMEAGWDLQSMTEHFTSHFKHGYCIDPDVGSGPLIAQPIGPYPGRPNSCELEVYRGTNAAA